MTQDWLDGIRQISHYRTAIAIVVPALGSGLAAASMYLVPRGRARGLITGAYMLLACVGVSCLLFGAVALLMGEPWSVVMPLFLVGFVLAMIMGLYSPEIIRQYQEFEFRKLAAQIFRRS